MEAEVVGGEVRTNSRRESAARASPLESDISVFSTTLVSCGYAGNRGGCSDISKCSLSSVGGWLCFVISDAGKELDGASVGDESGGDEDKSVISISTAGLVSFPAVTGAARLIA